MGTGGVGRPQIHPHASVASSGRGGESTRGVPGEGPQPSRGFCPGARPSLGTVGQERESPWILLRPLWAVLFRHCSIESFPVRSTAASGSPSSVSHRFTWTRDGKPFDLSDPRIIRLNGSGSFRIPNEGHITHFQGKYRCFAANALGVAMSEEAEFIVPSKFLRVHSQATMRWLLPAC